VVAGSCVEPGPECLAPANPGGGWDLTCRAVAQVLDGTSMRVRNVPGAGGGIAFAHVVAEREGDPNLIVAASPATTLRLAQGQFGVFEAKDVRWLAAVAADYGVIAVRRDAPATNSTTPTCLNWPTASHFRSSYCPTSPAASKPRETFCNSDANCCANRERI